MAYLALDLGAGSGRAIVGDIENNQIKIKEIHRFNTPPVQLGDTLYWDFLSLFSNIKEGIRLAIKDGHDIKGIAVDTWGVDFGLLDKSGRLLSNPVCYRDARTIGMSEYSKKYISVEQLYEITGIQQMEINSVFQLLSLKNTRDSLLSIADKLLFIPDLINYFLSGISCNEYTIASTSQLLNAKTRNWDKRISDRLELPFIQTPNIVHPGSLLGQLKKDIAEETGAYHAHIYAVGSHDTASAIAAIPSEGHDWAFLSSGTWSLLGVTSEEPVLTEKARINDFTNEGGVDNKILFMRNITGLWLLQRLIAEWNKEDNTQHSYEYLLSECDKSEPFQSIVNSDDIAFNNPPSMKKAIQDYCHKSGQNIPETKGELVRCVLESLAIKYHYVMKKLQECTGREINRLFIVGGGSQNQILNQYISDALNMEVVIGLTEATAIGNIIQQAIADKKIQNWKEAHQIIKNSFLFKSYFPQNNIEWKYNAERVKSLFI